MDRKAKPQDIEDLTQQVYENVLSALRRGKTIKDMRSYCLRTANNLLVSRYRHESGSVVEVVDAVEALPPVSHEVWLNEPQQKWAAMQRLKEVLRRVGDKLGEQFVTVLLLDRGAGFTDEELAREMDISIHTVRKFKTGVRSLCKTLKNEEQQK